LIYGEARRHSELVRQIYGERTEMFPQKIVANARTIVNVVQHLRDFGHFEINKINEIETSHEQVGTRRLANHLGAVGLFYSATTKFQARGKAELVFYTNLE
jgi:hypothetical protein